jgi:hypothetical protein
MQQILSPATPRPLDLSVNAITSSFCFALVFHPVTAFLLFFEVLLGEPVLASALAGAFGLFQGVAEVLLQLV